MQAISRFILEHKDILARGSLTEDEANNQVNTVFEVFLVCLYVCMYAWMDGWMDIRVRVCMCAFNCVFLSVSMYLYMSACYYVCMN